MERKASAAGDEGWGWGNTHITRACLGDALRAGVRRGDPQLIFYAWLCTSSGACRAALREQREEDGGKPLLTAAIHARNVGVVYELLCATRSSSSGGSSGPTPPTAPPCDDFVAVQRSTSVLHIAAACHARGVMIDMLIETCGVSVNCVDENGYTPLRLALRASTRHDNVETVRALLAHGARVDDAGGATAALGTLPPHVPWDYRQRIEPWGRRWTPLPIEMALTSASAACVRMLLAAGACLPPYALHWTLRLLKSERAERHVNTQFVDAVVDTCDVLVSEGGVSLIQRDWCGHTPFDIALSLRDAPIRRRLLCLLVTKFHGNMDAVCARDGASPLSVVTSLPDSEELMWHVLRRGANVNAFAWRRYTHLDMAIDQRRDARVVRALLLAGARMGSDHVRKAYVEHYERDANSWLAARDWEFVNACCEDGRSAGWVHRLARLMLLRRVVDTPSILEEMMGKLCLGRDKFVRMTTRIGGVSQCNALHCAVTTLAELPAGHGYDIDVRGGVDTLLRWGVDVGAYNEAGDTPLHIAVRSGQVKCAMYLIRAGADANALTRAGGEASTSGVHPLALAARCACAQDMIWMLRSHGSRMFSTRTWHDLSQDEDMGVVSALVDETCDAYASASASAGGMHATSAGALRFLIKRGSVCRAHISKLLAGAGCSPNDVDEEGVPMLYHAVRGGHADIVATLLTAGATARSITRDGDTALRCAARAGATNIVNMLIAAGAAD